MASRRKLPTGIQSFRKIREEGCYYVDKTAYALRFTEDAKHCFLSRPRRFGKSLFVDTLKELFEGSEELFRGLHIHDRWDWSAPHPVVRLDFCGSNFNVPGALQRNLSYQLDTIEEDTGVTTSHVHASFRFRELVETLHEKTGRRVVILVDEYDKPVLDALESPELAADNRKVLRNLYSSLKVLDAHIRQSFFTGVSKQVNILSVVNLRDLTTSPRYSAVCGFTEAELDAVFAPELEGLYRHTIRRWYNGYGWSGDETVYNPWDMLMLLSQRVFKGHWYQTGAPTFLIRKLLAEGVFLPRLDGRFADSLQLWTFDLEDIDITALMYQTGYLTITDVEDCPALGPRYRMGYPNHEVRTYLNGSLLHAMTPDAAHQVALGTSLRRLLAAADFAGIETLLRTFYASIPHDWHIDKDIGDYELYHASLFYSLFAASGVEVRTEDATSPGRLDMAAVLDERVCLFEFMVVEDAPSGTALAHLRERGYADKHRRLGREVHLAGVEFSRESHELTAFEVVTA